MTLGQRIQQIRIEHGLSQEQFAEKLGTTRQTVSRWELDQTYPEIAKIVLISRVFSVTTDSLLKDGISTFESDVAYFTCGVYRGPNCEIVETEKFAVVYYCSADKRILGTKLYKGYESKKHLIAVCEHEGRVVGFITGKVSGVLGEICNNAADRSANLKGIGQTMYKYMLGEFKRAGVRVVKVLTGLDDAHGPARRAYERAGFKRRLESVTYFMELD